MRLRIHHPLFAGFLGVIGLLVVTIVLLVGSGLRREMTGTFEAHVARELALAAAFVEQSDEDDPDALARAITELISYRVTVLDRDGRVLGDSYVEPGLVGAVENHDDRPEVLGAWAARGETTFAQRSSVTLGESLLYAARVARLGEQEVVLRIAAPQTEIAEPVGRVQRSVAVTGLVAMVIALIAALVLSVAFAQPLVVLADRARRLADGDFSARVPLGRVAELQDVSVAFNRLTDELETRLSELSRERDEMQTLIDCMAEGVVALTEDARLLRTNRAARRLLDLPDAPFFTPIGSMVRDPELRQALEESVRGGGRSREIVIGGRHLLLASRALDHGGAVTTFLDITELRRMERVRSDFVANASHELKTPLTAIRGFAETMVEEEPPTELRHQFVTAIRNNTLRLQRLVDDLLDLSRLESGGWTASLSPVTVGEVIREAWDLSRMGDREVAFEVEGDAVVLGDRRGLVQVFCNLFDNALRHTDAGGRITVAIQSGPGETVRIAISDDGEGIPARAIPRIFERFYRADSSRARDLGGTGLGLAIVKHLLTAMDGDIDVVSELGVGTTFTIELPEGTPAAV